MRVHSSSNRLMEVFRGHRCLISTSLQPSTISASNGQQRAFDFEPLPLRNHFQLLSVSSYHIRNLHWNWKCERHPRWPQPARSHRHQVMAHRMCASHLRQAPRRRRFVTSPLIIHGHDLTVLDWLLWNRCTFSSWRRATSRIMPSMRNWEGRQEVKEVIRDTRMPWRRVRRADSSCMVWYSTHQAR